MRTFGSRYCPSLSESYSPWKIIDCGMLLTVGHSCRECPGSGNNESTPLRLHRLGSNPNILKRFAVLNSHSVESPRLCKVAIYFICEPHLFVRLLARTFPWLLWFPQHPVGFSSLGNSRFGHRQSFLIDVNPSQCVASFPRCPYRVRL